ncbi:polyketide biosynthesis acyl carrier protein [Streptomyces sp. 1114.5]|uniref:acyl carrier protein n=1 Tax=unclassified Streptomyces TaxID=2593676 RepID=UPI000BD27FAC|nr:MULTISPECIES: phosphopantetheine-binding protein [unclassified Streptomyces]RKT17078.1 polyketide biosynthesis acyl carrier protein [Streptomyces sp. 1114.5]SOB83288.1 polyketide biosynthesis acyl carrier protein [Streptomyces sp. 1331.2]
MTTTTDNRARTAALVREVVGQILPGLSPEEITGDKHLKQLGADSVDRVEIILGLMDRLRVDEPMSSFSDLRDIDALIDFLVRAGGR